MDRIKKTSDGNRYILTPQNMWVRDFTKNSVPFIDLNKTIKPDDHFLFLKNEFENKLKRYTSIDSEKIYHPNIVILSDGFDFNKTQNLLENLKANITLITVNSALKKWKSNKNINYYIVNNPYEECTKYLPNTRRILPKCIASMRTNAKFLNNYNGPKFKYFPTNEKEYIGYGPREAIWCVDDYRNPICAAISLAYRFGVERLLLLCCDDVFPEERPGSVSLEDGLFTYPQQLIAHGLIDASLYWLRNQEYYNIKLGNCSYGPIYNNADKVNIEEINSFFEDD